MAELDFWKRKGLTKKNIDDSENTTPIGTSPRENAFSSQGLDINIQNLQGGTSGGNSALQTPTTEHNLLVGNHGKKVELNRLQTQGTIRRKLL